MVDTCIGQFRGNEIRLTLALVLPPLLLLDESAIRARSPDNDATCPLPPARSGEAHVYTKLVWVPFSAANLWAEDSIGLAERLRLLQRLTLRADTPMRFLVCSWEAMQRHRAFVVLHAVQTLTDNSNECINSDASESIGAFAARPRPWARAVQQSANGGGGNFWLVRDLPLASVEAIKGTELVSTNKAKREGPLPGAMAALSF